MPENTPLSSKTQILADLWMDYRTDTEFSDFCSYNDLGLPLAYMIVTNIVETNKIAEAFVNETFDLLLAALEIEEDEGYESLDDMFSL